MIYNIYNKNIEDLNLNAIMEFFCAIRTVSKKENKVYVALSGGSSVSKFYLLMEDMAKYLEKEFWEKVVFCFADERVVSLDDENSNYKYLKKVFFDKLIAENIIDENQIIPINPSSKDVAQDYNQKIKRVDIALLGVGTDCHTCSLFAKHPSIMSENKGYILVNNSPKLPPTRISMSKNMIKELQYSFIFFTDESKKVAYEKFNDKNSQINECPAKIALESQDCYVISNLK